MRTFFTILFFISLTFFSFDALVNGIFNADKYSFSLSDPAENSQNDGHFLNLDHENNDHIFYHGIFNYSPGKEINIVSMRAALYYFAASQFTWRPPEK
jgi:hypothetical protein